MVRLGPGAAGPARRACDRDVERRSGARLEPKQMRATAARPRVLWHRLPKAWRDLDHRQGATRLRSLGLRCPLIKGTLKR